MPSLVSRLVARALPVLGAALLAALPLAAQQPANDVCSGATVIPGSGPFPFTVSENTRSTFDDASDPIFCNDKQLVSPNFTTKSVWFTFTPTTTDTYKIDTLGTTADVGQSYDTILGVFTGDCPDLTLVTCNDDAGGSTNSAVTVALTAGTKYTILVAGLGSRDFLNPAKVIPTAGGDLILHIGVAPVTYLYSYAIASVAHIEGVTLFTSDLYVTSTDSAVGQFNIQFLGHVNVGDSAPPSSQPVTSTQTILGNGTKTFVDILSAVFGTQADYGALLIQSTKKLQIGAKTFSPGPFAQYTDGVEVSDSSAYLLNQNESGRIVGVRENAADPGDTKGFRTNVALFNMGTGPCTAQVGVFDTNGLLLAGAKTYTIPARTMVQLNRLKTSLGISVDVQDAAVGVKALSAACRLGAAGYVVSNSTNDPFTSLMRKGASFF